MSAELMTTAQAAGKIGVTMQTLANWRARGKGPRFLRQGGWRVLYRPADVEAWAREWSTPKVA